MGRKHAKPEQIVAMLNELTLRHGAGKDISELVETIRDSERVYDRWRRLYGKRVVALKQSLPELERERERKRKALAARKGAFKRPSVSNNFVC